MLDTETGGLEPQNSGVWDLAAVAVQDGALVSEFETRVWPGREFLQAPQRDVMQRISGLTSDDILRLLDADVPDVSTARNRLMEWMAGLTSAKHVGEDVKGERCDWTGCHGGQMHGTVAGFCAGCRGSGYKDVPRTRFPITSYNLGFDSKFLEAVHWSLPFHVSALFHAQVEWAPCLMVATAEHLGPKLNLPKRDGRYRWVKLAYACQHLDIPFEETHRALSDARAAARIAVKLGVGL